jgi:uncharacterized RDD family membrane protein YckC
MVGRRDIGSWLSGPGVASDTPPGYPGERLGRPASGAGSVARPGRRLIGIIVDWVVATAVAAALVPSLGRSAGPLLVLLLEHAVLVGTAGSSLGHRAAGLRVERVDGAAAGIGRAALRALLLCLAVPALSWDRDQRGLHDQAAGTIIVRR